MESPKATKKKDIREAIFETWLGKKLINRTQRWVFVARQKPYDETKHGVRNLMKYV